MAVYYKLLQKIAIKQSIETIESLFLNLKTRITDGSTSDGLTMLKYSMEQAMQQETSVSGTHSDSGGGFAGIVKDPPSLLLTEDPLAGWDVSGSAVVICLLSRLAFFKTTQVNFSYEQL